MTGETLRAIHERCKARHAKRVFDDDTHLEPECYHCCEPFPCPDYSDAVAALAILDAADHWYPVEGDRMATLAEPDDISDGAYVHLPDPLPVDATAREPAGDT